MALPKDEKLKIIAEYRLHENDSGSPEVQVALPHPKNHAAHRALQVAQDRPPQSAGSAADGRSAATALELPQGNRDRALSRDHQEARNPTVAAARTSRIGVRRFGAKVAPKRVFERCRGTTGDINVVQASGVRSRWSHPEHRDRSAGETGGRRGGRAIWRIGGARGRHRIEAGSGFRLLAPVRRLPGEGVRGGEDPGWLLQA